MVGRLEERLRCDHAKVYILHPLGPRIQFVSVLAAGYHATGNARVRAHLPMHTRPYFASPGRETTPDDAADIDGKA